MKEYDLKPGTRFMSKKNGKRYEVVVSPIENFCKDCCFNKKNMGV